MFMKEIGQLDADSRLKFRSRKQEFIPDGEVISQMVQKQNKLLLESSVNDKLEEMSLYLLFQTQEFYKKNDIFFKQVSYFFFIINNKNPSGIELGLGFDFALSRSCDG